MGGKTAPFYAGKQQDGLSLSLQETDLLSSVKEYTAMKPMEHALYILRFIQTFYQYDDQNKAQREAACLKLQFSHCLLLPDNDDLLFGKYEIPCIGFAMQESGMGYYFNSSLYKSLLSQLPAEMKNLLEQSMSEWKRETGREQLLSAMSPSMRAVIPSDRFEQESNVGFWLCRMSGTQLDFDRLLQEGIPGLMEQVRKAEKKTSDPSSIPLYRGMELLLVSVQEILLHCCHRILESSHPHRLLLADTFRRIAFQKPETFHQAVQLMYLYAVISGTYNYGRMDEYLGDFYVRDLESGRMTEIQAEQLLSSLFRSMIHRKTTWDGRVVIGGLGRRNEENADRLALALIRVSGQVRDVLPQLSLRFYQKQNPALMELALSQIEKGCVYPILYNDDVNIPDVEASFHVSWDEAVQYLPFGCGEYVLYHRSVGTPSDIINLLKALEITIFNGYDLITGRMIGPATGEFTEFQDFESFFQAYCIQLERYIDMQARHQALEYRIAASHSPFLAASILYDDCIFRGKPIFDGGARYIGATLETYGNINTADSLTAIRKLVFEEKKIASKDLPLMLKNNFEGYEKERSLLLSAPKYGNDDPEADEMAARVENHVCDFTAASAQKYGLHTHLVVVINNSANTSLGRFTLASADGRKSGEPMANANNPSGGSDQSGLTALLQSLSGFPRRNQAGIVQNLKLSKDLFTRHPEEVKAALEVYFLRGGSQLMINVLGRDDLENAMREPEKYRNLIVRVGGFCARFVELDRKVQEEILSRTLY